MPRRPPSSPQRGAALEIREVPVPQPGPGQVLVKIEASGLCHTDIHAARGDWPVKPGIPLIPGHEGVSTIESLGHGVDTLAIGWVVRRRSPPSVTAVGHASHDIRVPEGVSSFDAAPPPTGRTMDDGKVDLYWLPLGAGGHCVRANGRVYEAIAARVGGRQSAVPEP